MKYYGISIISSEGKYIPTVMPMYTAEDHPTLERGTRPYTVVEILTRVFNADFCEIIRNIVDQYPEYIEKAVKVPGSKDFRLIWLSRPKVESSLAQPMCCIAVDILLNAKFEALVPAVHDRSEKTVLGAEFRVRYYLELWARSCSIPIVGARDFFTPDYITEQKTRITNQYLLPIIRNNEYGDITRTMLKQYYPEALERPTAVEGYELAGRMKIDVRTVRFEPGSNIYGRIYFARTEVTIIENGLRKKEQISPMTILINAELCRSDEVINSTIVHECCHVYLNLPFFMLQRLSGNQYTSFTSREKMKYTVTNDPIDWMEIQARKLSACVLLNEDSVRKVVNGYLACYQGNRTPGVMLGAVELVASVFKVSMSMAKYRLIELGYHEAEGVYVYVDNKRIPDHGCKGPWSPGITYVISREDAVTLLGESETFCRALAGGCYIYAEGHYCLNDEEYVNRKTRTLTQYARDHIDECCLSFRVRSSYTDTEYEFGQASRKKESKTHYRSRHDFNSEPGSKERILQNSRFTEDAQIWDDLLCSMPFSFKEAVQTVIDRKGITQNELAMRIGISRGTLTKWLSRKTTLRHVVAICLGINVRPDIAIELVKRAGCWFRNDLENNLMKAMLFEGGDIDVAIGNGIMIQNNLPPLTNGVNDAAS